MYTDIHPVVSVGYPKKKKTRLHAFIARSKKRGGGICRGICVRRYKCVQMCCAPHVCRPPRVVRPRASSLGSHETSGRPSENAAYNRLSSPYQDETIIDHAGRVAFSGPPSGARVHCRVQHHSKRKDGPKDSPIGIGSGKDAIVC